MPPSSPSETAAALVQTSPRGFGVTRPTFIGTPPGSSSSFACVATVMPPACSAQDCISLAARNMPKALRDNLALLVTWALGAAAITHPYSALITGAGLLYTLSVRLL